MQLGKFTSKELVEMMVRASEPETPPVDEAPAPEAQPEPETPKEER